MMEDMSWRVLEMPQNEWMMWKVEFDKLNGGV